MPLQPCPNHALAPDGPAMLDVRRCTAYYTTHRPRPLPPDLDTRGYTRGCDLCQLACPFNKSPLFPYRITTICLEFNLSLT